MRFSVKLTMTSYQGFQSQCCNFVLEFSKSLAKKDGIDLAPLSSLYW